MFSLLLNRKKIHFLSVFLLSDLLSPGQADTAWEASEIKIVYQNIFSTFQ
jgi:hypothetical protein